MLKQINDLTEFQLTYREKIKAEAEASKHNPEHDKIHVSPCGKYTLRIEQRERRCVGVLYEGEEILERIGRNYSFFPFDWATGHPDGHDYLVCSENYQGQTLICLDKRERVDYLGAGESGGYAWIWANIQVSPDRKHIAVSGCHWAFPYEVRVFEFTNPMSQPGEPVFLPKDFSNMCRWLEDGSLEYGEEGDYCLLLNMFEDDMTDEQYKTSDKMFNEAIAQGQDEDDLWVCRIKNPQVWRPGT
jgi:hypothetical protein